MIRTLCAARSFACLFDRNRSDGWTQLLTDRELEVTRLLSAGRSNADVAQQLGISEHTARRHTERVLSKLGARSRAEVPGLLLGHAAPRLAVDA